MNFFRLIGLSIVMIAFGALYAFANPNMLPKHEGYPMGKAIDPVTGQALSNDPGQKNATGARALQQAAAAEDGHIRQNLASNSNDERVSETSGAGRLPKVERPQVRIEPPVNEATKTPADPKE